MVRKKQSPRISWILFFSALKKNRVQKQFWTSESAQTRKPALSLLCVFWFGHFPRFKLVSESIFYTKTYIITILNFFFGASKNGLSIVFKNVI